MRRIRGRDRAPSEPLRAYDLLTRLLRTLEPLPLGLLLSAPARC